MRSRPRRKLERGVALIIVLWVMVLLAVMVQSFMVESRVDAQLTRNLIENSEARALADGGIHAAVARLMQERTNPSAVFDGQPIMLVQNGAAVTVAIQDEGGKINLNTASDALLKTLFRSSGLDDDAASELVDRIADWRDGNNLRRLNGAEDADYRAADLPYGAKDQAFFAVEELKLVLGVTPERYAHVAPALTVYDNKRGVDLRAAPAAVLQALTAEGGDLIDEFVAARREGDTEAINRTQQSFGLSGRFVTRSSRSVFTIRASAQTDKGARFTRMAVVRFRKNQVPPYTLLAWRRGGG